MRISLGLAACIGTAALFTITACEPDHPVKGTVVEKEYQAAKPGKQKKTCQTRKFRRPVCTTHITGSKSECYELEIRTEDGDTVDVCDKAAFNVLRPDDLYDSSQDYNREDQ